MIKTDGEILASINYTISKMPDNIAKAIFKELGHCDLSSYNGKYKDQIKQWQGHNIVPLLIRSELASLIAGNTVTPTFKANYLALGADATPANINDIKLGSETIRGIFTDRRSIDNVAFLDKFFGSVEVGGNNYNEVGIFIDGLVGVDTGFLLSRININETMQALESLTINAVITIA